MFRYSKYWGKWSRVLLHPGSLVDGRKYGSYLEVNLSPIINARGVGTEEDRYYWVRRIVIREHGTSPQPGEMRDHLPQQVFDWIVAKVGHDLARRLVQDDLLSEIDLDRMKRNMRGGGIPLAECRKV